MNEAHREHSSESPEASSAASPSENGGRGNVPTSTGPASGRVSGRELGALAGNRQTKIVTVRAPRPDELPICQRGGCEDPIAVVVVIPGAVGEWKVRLCLNDAQSLLMELAETIGVGRRSTERPSDSIAAAFSDLPPGVSS